VLLLPHSYFCYRPPVDAPEVAPPPLCRTGQITFGSFNTLPKISDRTLALWGSVLRAVPASRLLIKGQAMREPAARERLWARCASAGIARRRVEVIDWQSDLRSHLNCYGQVDVALDTFPYNGATTTCEALWMGVPVVSLCGETHVARVGLSILKAAGRGSWVVNSAEEFVATCVALTADPDRLAAQRAALRAALKTSALMDEVSYVRDFEKLLSVAAGQGR
jgi:predicted O-linked N-acetylglucosamine transferase (SPINDLY family)